MAHNTASREQLADFPHFGGFLNADGPWDLDQLKRMQDDCRNADMVLEAVRMDSAYIIMKEGPVRERYLDIIRENIRRVGQAGSHAGYDALDHDSDLSKLQRARPRRFDL